MEQKLEGDDLQLNINLKGGKGELSIFANKVRYEAGVLMFFLDEKEILRVSLTKEYKTIYDALKSIGIDAVGY